MGADVADVAGRSVLRAKSLDLTDDERGGIEERAAIVEFEGGLTRLEAERLAFAWIVAGR